MMRMLTMLTMTTMTTTKKNEKETTIDDDDEDPRDRIMPITDQIIRIRDGSREIYGSSGILDRYTRTAGYNLFAVRVRVPGSGIADA
jgi:hypothetical protein